MTWNLGHFFWLYDGPRTQQNNCCHHPKIQRNYIHAKVLYISCLYLQQLESSVAPIYCYFTKVPLLTSLYSVSAISLYKQTNGHNGRTEPPQLLSLNCLLWCESAQEMPTAAAKEGKTGIRYKRFLMLLPWCTAKESRGKGQNLLFSLISVRIKSQLE